MANTRGVFSSRRISEEKIPFNEWVDLDNVWHYPSPGAEGPNVGYYGGGKGGPTVTTVDKTNYTNDTTAAVPGANLSSTP